MSEGRLAQRVESALASACRTLALVGGTVLVALALVAVVSVVSRALLDQPVPGDFELVQIGCAVAIACFLPYTQWRRANLIVDFFTLRVSRPVQSLLDRIGSLILGCVMGLLCWRIGVGALDMQSSGETSMILGLPIWWVYAALCPAFGLTSLVGIYLALGPERARR